MTLFVRGKFVSHSGIALDWKIECDSLTDADIECIAWVLFKKVGQFGSVEGVPRGGIRLADAMRKYVSSGNLLIVDDVFTTGNSMEEHRNMRFAKGAVIFATSPTPYWIIPVFTMEC